MGNKTTILISHPNLSNSIFNNYLADIHKKNALFSVHHLDKNRVNGYFDVEKEKSLLKESDSLIWQFPIYWYNSPSSLRDWQDQVLSPIVYSADNFLKGKTVRVIFTAGAGKENYSHDGLNRYTANEMLVPFEMTVKASGMEWLEPIGFYGCCEERKTEVFEEMEKVMEMISR